MINDSEKLKKFVQLLKDLRSMEVIYDDLLNCEIPNDPPDFFNLYCELLQNIETIVNVKNLSANKIKIYDGLITEVYGYVGRDHLRLYKISGNIEEVLYEGVEAANNAIKNILKPFEGQKRPSFLCGYSSLEIYIRPISFIGLLLRDELLSLDGYKYSDGILTLDLNKIISEFKLNVQEYQIFTSAYKATLEVLQRRLQVKGNIESFID